MTRFTLNHLEIDKATIGIGMDEPHLNAMADLETADRSPHLSFDRKITCTNPHAFLGGTRDESWEDVPDAVSESNGRDALLYLPLHLVGVVFPRGAMKGEGLEFRKLIGRLPVFKDCLK